MSTTSRCLLTAIVLATGSLASAQTLQPDRKFQQRSPADLVRVARSAPRTASEPAPPDELLYRWQKAIRKFLDVAKFVEHENLPEAAAQLETLKRDLRGPYANTAATLSDNLNDLLKEAPPDDKLRPRTYLFYLTLAQICCELGDRDRASRLLFRAVAPGRAPETKGRSFETDLSKFDLYPDEWAALARQFNGHQTDWYLKSRCAWSAQDPFSDWVDRRTFGMTLAALDQQHLKLPADAPTNDKVRLYQTTISVFCRERFYAEDCEAWRSKLLIDFRENSSACAEVYLDRATEEYISGKREVALAIYLKVIRDYPKSSVDGKAHCNVGILLQERGRYRDAIDAYQEVFSNEDKQGLGANIMTLIVSTYSEAARNLADCYETIGDFEHALQWNELARTKYPSRSGCGNCMAEIEMNNAVQRGRLLAKLGRRAEAIAILEPLVVQRSNGFSNCPAEAFWTLVDTYTERKQLDDFEAKWHKDEKAKAASAEEELVVGKKYETPTLKAIELRRLILSGSCADLWRVIVEFGFTPYEIYSDRKSRKQAEIPNFDRRAAVALLKRTDAGPFLREKLRGTEFEKGWAIVLLAQLKHPDVGAILERAAANGLAHPERYPWAFELRRSLCCAIALHDAPSSRDLMTQYGIGTTSEIFSGQDLASLRVHHAKD